MDEIRQNLVNINAAQNRKKDELTWREKNGRKDPDLKCPVHDSMCIAMIDLTFVANLLVNAGVPVKRVIEAHNEYPISKGERQYKCIVGYADLSASIEAIRTLPSRISNERFLIEAKTSLENPFETMRQLREYVTYERIKWKDTHGVLWFPGISGEHKTLFLKNNFYVCSATIEDISGI